MAESKAGGPSQRGEHGCSQPQGGGPGLLYTDKESVFGHFTMSGNSNGELLCQNYCLGYAF